MTIVITAAVVVALVVYFAVLFMLIYTVLMYFYDIALNQNILDLVEPIIPLEKMFGPWPIYIFVDIAIALLWYAAIYFVARKFGVVAVASQQLNRK